MRRYIEVTTDFKSILQAVEDKINSDRCRAKPHWLDEPELTVMGKVVEEYLEWLDAYFKSEGEVEELVDLIASALMLADKLTSKI
jgi:hypothetical protein